MSAGGAFGGNRGVRPVPPEKGVFPLDHLHECDLEKKDYLVCMKSTGFQSEMSAVLKEVSGMSDGEKLNGEARHGRTWVQKSG